MTGFGWHKVELCEWQNHFTWIIGNILQNSNAERMRPKWPSGLCMLVWYIHSSESGRGSQTRPVNFATRVHRAFRTVSVQQPGSR